MQVFYEHKYKFHQAGQKYLLLTSEKMTDLSDPSLLYMA